jgi:hypothetical protein
MKRSVKTSLRETMKKLAVVVLVWTVGVAGFVFSPRGSQATSAPSSFDLYRKKVPNVDVNQLAQAVRQPTALQLNALEQFKGVYGSQATVRWNKFAGSPDVINGFHTAPSNDTPENAARSFVNSNSALFGVDSSSLVLVSHKEALGGHLLRFQQKAGDLNVSTGGVGFFMNDRKQIRMVMGSSFRDVSAPTNAALTAAAAAARVETDLAQYAMRVPSGLDHLLTPALDAVAAELAPVLRAPRLNIFPTADGYKLAWDCITFSRNPFGLFLTQVDANTGEILSRENLVKAQSELPYTADIYPSTPGIKNYDTGELELVNGEPKGLQRVNLRNTNPGTNVTAVDGVISGKHALVRNVLATKQPFAQAAGGTFHFRKNNAPLEAQPNEADDLAEPSEHFDGVNMYFFINYLLEYVDDIHKRADSVHSRVGQGDFPDAYPNSDRPLVGLVHMPNAPGVLGAEPDTTNQDTLVRSLLGLDNAFSVPASQTIDTPNGPQTVVVNPTLYGHGYWLNDLAKDGPVAYHEGMHSVSTVIAGLEGAPEGGALNEAQADLWAYAITGDDAIGAHSIKGSIYRRMARDAGRDPDSLAWIRSARSTIKYSQLGTYRPSSTAPPAFEEHRDGEIFAATMFELLELMKAAEPQMQFKRPALIDGQPTKTITRGQEAWERIFLGGLYILGTTAPDTFVKFRDAVIEADRALYSTDPSDLDAPGQHEALIWQVFAAREMGVNAQSPIGGAVTISTGVTQFALEQASAGVPQSVKLEPGNKSVKVSWQPVNGAYAYQVFKRKIGKAGQRQYPGVTGRIYFDGDQSTSGWAHVGYTNAANYEDKGKIEEFFAAAGIKSTDDANGFNEMFDSEYAVRAISVNPNRQSGFSDLSASASFTSSIQDVTNAVSSAISNVSFANGIFEFDNKLTNNGITGADSTAYGPVSFKVVRISNPTVTVANADNGGNGRDVPGVFGYNQTLTAGQTSAAKRLKFNDPYAQMFSFDALVTARVRGASVPTTGSQSYDGDGGGRVDRTFSTQTDVLDGVIVLGSAGQNVLNGVDYVDVPFVAKPDSFGVTGRLTTTVFCDVDFELRDSKGNVLATSGNLGPNEEVSSQIIPGQTYVYRVVGYGNGPTPFRIESEQFFTSVNGGGGGSSFGQQTTGFSSTRLVRFTVNPLTRAVTARIL